MVVTGSAGVSTTVSRTRAWLVPAVLSVLLAVQVGVAAPASAATPVTYADFTYPTAVASPSADKPQSKLWYNDGSWWGLMTTTGGVYIHRLGADHVWRNTGTLVDERVTSTGDALWENGKLYVGTRVSNGAMRVLVFSYSGGTYTRDSSQQVASNGTESMSVDRDSLGRLWIAYTQASRVYTAHSAPNNYTSWTAPFLVPVSDNTVTSDDIAGVIAFNGMVGIMWSDQGNDVMRFAVHADSAADSTWSLEAALSGPNLADDHLNLKSLSGDSQGRLFAAVKTSRGDAGEPSTDPSIVVLQRSSSGTWTNAVAARVGDKLTRAQIALDGTNGRLYILMAIEGGGPTVYYKSAPLGALSFGTGRGAAFIQASNTAINDPSTTKQTVYATTGLVVIASDKNSHRYYHGELSLGAPTTDTTAPSVPTNVAGSPTSNSVTLSWTASSDNVGVTGYRVFRNGTQIGTPTGTSFTDTGLAASTTYSYTVAAVDAAGNVSAPSSPATSVTTLSGSTTPPPASGISFVGAATASGAAASTTVAAPAGATTGDVLVAVVSTRGAPTIATPTGWTLVRTDTNSTTMRQAVFVRAATTSNASTWTLSSAKDNVVQVIAYRGVDTANPVVGAAGALSTTATITSPATTSVAGGTAVTVAGIACTATLAPASPLTERSEVTNASTASYKITADAADTSTGATTAGPFSVAASGSAGGIGQTVTLRPAA